VKFGMLAVDKRICGKGDGRTAPGGYVFQKKKPPRKRVGKAVLPDSLQENRD